MKLYCLVHPGIETLAAKEVEELLQVKAEIQSQIISFSATPEQAFLYLRHAQAVRRVLLAVGEGLLEEINYSEVVWKEVFTKELTTKVVVEGVSGNDQRIALAKAVMEDISPAIEASCGFSVGVNLKHPDVTLFVFHNGEQYFVGIDLAGREINQRDYRVFPHQASVKGDIAYYFVRYTGFTLGESLLVGNMKDGTFPLEAALYAAHKQVSPEPFACQLFPLFSEVPAEQAKTLPQSYIVGCEESQLNFTAARKNAKIAGVPVNLKKCALDAYDERFSEGQFQRIMFHITAKDEDKLNELYYQSAYLLAPQGTLLFIARKQWEISISAKFTLKSKDFFTLGQHTYCLWLLEKK